jgi:hypothetical protein
MTLKTFSLLLAASFLFTACDSKSKTSSKSAEKNVSKNQTLLINGYSQMYQTLGAFKWTDELLAVKFNSKEVQDFGGRLDEAATKIGERLEYLQDSEKWLNLENTGASELQSKLFSSLTKERIKSYTPVVGLDGAIFERTFLLVGSGILNQMQHLTYVMLEVEEDEKRREFLEMAQKSFENLREEDLKLLNSKYFKHDKFSKK